MTETRTFVFSPQRQLAPAFLLRGHAFPFLYSSVALLHYEELSWMQTIAHRRHVRRCPFT